MPNRSSVNASTSIRLDMATLSTFGITFYSGDCKGNIDPKSHNSLEEDCTSYEGSNSIDYEQVHTATVSPRLSNILHKFSVPQGIVSIKSPKLIQRSAVPSNHCSAVESSTERIEKVTLQNIPEESNSIDDESMPVEPALENLNRRGRKRLPKEVVIPGEWYCKPCDKNFMSKGGLSQHTNARHAKNKTHQCDICNKRFEFPQDMEEHRARHSADNKPHECSFEGCNRRFMYRFDLNRHFMKNHGNVTYHCTICAKGFARKDHLVKHLISHKNKTVMKISIKQM